MFRRLEYSHNEKLVQLTELAQAWFCSRQSHQYSYQHRSYQWGLQNHDLHRTRCDQTMTYLVTCYCTRCETCDRVELLDWRITCQMRDTDVWWINLQKKSKLSKGWQSTSKRWLYRILLRLFQNSCNIEYRNSWLPKIFGIAKTQHTSTNPSSGEYWPPLNSRRQHSTAIGRQDSWSHYRSPTDFQQAVCL